MKNKVKLPILTQADMNNIYKIYEPSFAVASWEVSPGVHIFLYSHVNWFHRKMIKICFGWKYNIIQP